MNGLTHFIGALLAIAALVLLLVRDEVTTRHIVAFSLFGSAMILLYTFSTLYHWLPIDGKKLLIFRKIDHIMIFFFIAMSYAPLALVVLEGAWGWSLFGTVLGIMLFGLFLKIFWMDAPRFLSTLIYVLMGWLVVIGLWPLSQKLPNMALFWLFSGGVFYTVGAVIYAKKRPNPRYFGFHEIFHVFIMLGSFSHFWLMYQYV
jgi:hemolysin III